MLIPLIQAGFDTGSRHYSFAGVSSPSAWYSDQILSIGPITREVPAVPGGYRISNTEVRFKNASGEFSKLRSETSWRNREFKILFGDVAQGLAGMTTIYTGKVFDYRITPQECRIVLRDASFDLFRVQLGGWIDRIDFPNYPADRELFLKPIIYGAVSSSGESATGAVPCYRADPAVGQAKFRYLVARHVCKSVVNAYKYGVLQATGFTVSTVLVGGVNHTFIDFAADPFDPARVSELEVTADVQGITDDGTATGNLITNPVEQLEHYLKNYAGVTAAQISNTLFDKASSNAASNGYTGGFSILAKDIKHEDVINRFVESYGMPFFVDRTGLFGAYLFSIDDLTGIDSTTLFTDENDVVRGSFHVDGPEIVASRLQYNWFYQWARQFFEKQPDLIDTEQETALAQDIRQNVNLWHVRQELTARDLAEERLYLMRESQQVVHFDLPIRHYDQDLNDYVRVTHFRGVGPSPGYSSTTVRLIRLNINVQPSSMRVSATGLRVFDTDDIWLRYIKLGDENEISADWTTASEADKQYGYLGDEADPTGSPEGTLGASDPIKLLF